MRKSKLNWYQERQKLGMFRGVDYRDYGPGNYIKSRHHYETGRFRFDMTNCEARSYDWWVFVLRVDATIYVNDTSYSMQTSKHQSMAHAILSAEMPERHGLKVVKVYYKEGLQNLELAIKNMYYEIDQLVDAIHKPRSWKSTNESRRERINYLYERIAETEKLKPIFDCQIALNLAERAERYDKYEQDLQQRRLQRVPKYKQVIEIFNKSVGNSNVIK